MEDILDKTTKYIDKILTAPANIQNKQIELLKSIVLDLGQFDGNKTKFENQWREIILFLKSNRVTVIDNKIIAVSEMLKEWKVTITSVSQEYKSTEGKQDYRMETEMTYRERSIPMNTRKAKNNFNKDKRPKCFNCNVYKHIVKDCRKPKKE